MAILNALWLVVVVAGAAAGTRAVLRAVGEARGSVAFAVTLGWLAVALDVASRPFDDLRVGGALVAALGVLAALALRRRAGAVAAADLAVAPAPTRGAIGAALVSALPLLYVTWTTNFWDEVHSHIPYAEIIARGVLPPVHPLFPDDPLLYHYSYDVLVGAVLRGTGMPVAAACDVVTTACIVAMLWIIHDVGHALGGPRLAFLSVLLVPFAGGVAVHCLADGWNGDVKDAHAMCSAWFPASWVTWETPPPTVSNFLQHPQGLAMSVAPAAIALALLRPSHEGAAYARAVVVAAVVASLAPAQTTYFLIIGAALGAAFAVRLVRHRRAQDAVQLALLALCLPVAHFLGGMIRLDGTSSEHLRFGVGQFAQYSLGEALALHVLLFAPPLFALPLVVTVARRAGVEAAAAFGVAAGLGFVVGDVASYDRSDAALKLFGASGYFVAFLFALLVAVLWERARAGWRVLAVALALLASVSGALWLLRFGPLNGALGVYHIGPATPARVWAIAAAIGDDVGPRERILSRHLDLHQAGLIVVGAQWQALGSHLMMDREAQDMRRGLALGAWENLDDKVLDVLDVTFVLVGDEERALLGPAAAAALADPGRFTTVRSLTAAGESLTLYRRLRAAGDR